MRLLALLCSLAVCLAATPAQQPAPSNSDPTKEQKEQPSVKPGSIKSGSIRGRIIGDDGQPMANIHVVAAPIGRSAARGMGPVGQGAQTNTDDDGNFEFEDLARASYVISASAPGYITPPPLEEEDSVGVYRTGDFASIMLVKGGVITGKVANVAGEPLTGVSVNAIRVGGVDGESENQPVFQGFGRNWRADDRGVYRIYGLVPGAYIVQAGGASGAGPDIRSAFSGDAPTYYPSSAREAATPVSVRAGEEIAGIDISYRGGKGRVVSGRVMAKTGDDGARFSPTQIILSIAGSDAVVATALQMDRGQMNRRQMGRSASSGFALYGIPDGEYEVVARRGGIGAESDAISAARRVSIRGADASGIELVLTPLASLSGRVVVEKNTAACQKQRASSVEEILIAAERDEAQVREATLASRLAPTRPAAPNAIGEFTLRNLGAGRHRVIAQLPDENWYLRAIAMEGKPSAPSARGTATPAPVNVARNGVTFKTGEKLTGITVTIAEGAAGLKGQVVIDQGGKPSGKARAHLIPAEKEAADDVLRYSQMNVSGDGSFHFKNLAPGRYYLLAKPIKDGETGGLSAKLSGRLQALDNAERAALRREAEAAGNVIELQACQRVSDYKLSSQYR
ncbi:MAG: carboxypeptidase regulatory-like domain-containing protein [Blastocatellia bacterium]